MQIIDNKYRLFGVINLIDLAVVIALLAGGFAVYKVLTPSPVPTPGSGSSSNLKTATFVFFCPTLRNFSPSQVKVGDLVYKTSGKVIGKVTAVRSAPTPGDVWDTVNGKITRFDSTVNVDAFITVVGQGEPTSTGFAVSDLLIHINQPFPIMTSTFESDGAVVADMKIAGE